MGSILDVLPREGALFAGRVGAVRLPEGQVLIVTSAGAHVSVTAEEPSDNAIPAPEESLTVRRPAYMQTYPLIGQHSPAAAEESSWSDAFKRLWPLRDEPDAYVRQDPYTGSMIKVAQALRKAAARQELAVALSFQLRTGDIADAEVRYQLAKAIEGIADAARMFRLPVVAGDLQVEPATGLWPKLEVSAYGAAAGRFSSAGTDVVPGAAVAGDEIALLGRMTNDLSGSLYAGATEGFPPPIDLVLEGRALEIAQRTGSAAPLGRGGLLVALARCCAAARIGARVVLPAAWQTATPAARLFGEAQSRFLLLLAAERVEGVFELAAQLDVPIERLGRLGGEELIVDTAINLDVRELT